MLRARLGVVLRRGRRRFSTQAGGYSYSALLERYPLATAGVTGSVLWAIGDVFAQKFESRKKARKRRKAGQDPVPQPMDMMRLAGSIVHGGIVSGIGNQIWYAQLDRGVRTVIRLAPGTGAFVASKVALELALFTPFSLLCYWSLLGLFEGDSIERIANDLRANFVGTWVGDATLWAPVEVLFFWKVPVSHQMLTANCFVVLEAAILSHVHELGFKEILREAGLSSLIRGTCSVAGGLQSQGADHEGSMTHPKRRRKLVNELLADAEIGPAG